MRKTRLIPYLCSAGGQVAGSEKGALDLAASGLAETLCGHGLNVAWHADPMERYHLPHAQKAHAALPSLGTAARRDIVLAHCRQLQADVLDVMAGGALPVTLGGDHAMALASISAVAKARDAFGRTGVIWIDAHPDFNTPATSPSQAFHGMPLAALTGRGDRDYVALAGRDAVLRPENIVYIAIRDIDPGEQDYLDRFGITSFTMEDIDRFGLDVVFAKAREAVMRDTDARVLSIDLDGFDPSFAPAVGTPVPGGLDPDTALPAIADLVKEIHFDLIEIAEYNPTLPGVDATRGLVFRILKELLSAGL